MLKNYLTYPTYNVGKFTLLNGVSSLSSEHIDFNPETDFFSTIPSADWLYFAEAAYSAFKESLANDEGTDGRYDLDSYEKKLVVDEIRSNSGDAVKTEKKETVVYSETLEEFEREYQAFIEMLKAQKAQKS